MPTLECRPIFEPGRQDYGCLMAKQEMTHALWYGGRGGSGGYMRYLNGVLAIPAAPTGIRITLVCSPSLKNELGPLDSAVCLIPVPSLENSISAQVWERMHFTRFVRELRPDVLFYPSGTLGSFPAGVPVVAACHNLLYFDDKEYRKYRFSAPWLRSLWRLRRRHRVLYPKAAGVIFFSPYSQELAERNVAGIKFCTVIPHGVEANFLADSPTPSIDRPPLNILYISTVTIYKHQWNVVKAVKQLRDSTGEDYQLWLVGSADQLGRKALDRALKKERAEAFAHWMGGVSHDAMPSLLRNADIFLFASSCEAFGITLLEAMASGLPVACSNRSGLPDLLRDGGVYFDPENCTEIASAVARLSADKVMRREYAERAMRYAREFTWSGCAEKTFAFLRDVAVTAQNDRTV
ncbi:MAG: glycosyltransferase family 1 protein [Terracidiphilus sp.]